MAAIEDYIERVRDLSLLDIAYLLWIERRSFDQTELRGQPSASLDLSKPKVFEKLVRDVFESVLTSQRTAHDGPTYARLKYLRPEVEDDRLKDVIKKAVRFDQACVKNFHYNSENYLDDCRIAVAFAAAENPGFSDKSIAIAEEKLMIAMR